MSMHYICVEIGGPLANLYTGHYSKIRGHFSDITQLNKYE